MPRNARNSRKDQEKTEKKKWYVVEFADNSVSIIPENWFMSSDHQVCTYPEKDYEKSLEGQESPGQRHNKWRTWGIERVFTPNGVGNYGMMKHF